MSAPDVSTRNGFAAPLAVFMLIAIALLMLLMLEGALGELRTRAAEAVETRVAVAAETELAGALFHGLDSAVFNLPVGAVVWKRSGDNRDSVVAQLQLLGDSVARIVVTARSRDARFRAKAEIRAYVRIFPSSKRSGEFELAPLGANWWVPSP